MLHFQYASEINATPTTVWQFHERQDILDLLTPPWQPVTVVRREGGLGVGAITEFRLQLGPVPVKWLARHTECEHERLFTDIQVEGPLVSWTHRHLFTPIRDNQTLLTDAIAYELPGGIPAETILAGWVNSRLADMFAYRHQITSQYCESA
ncbi:MAG: SRPBCC family protein [Cyanobacteria bacterium P01_H01_bin.15]